MPRARKSIESALETKGFVKSEGDHHYFTFVAEDGRKSRARTKTSHSMRTISDGLLCLMARQCHLTKSDFLRLVDCPLTREEYELRLSDQGHFDQASAR